MMVNYRDVRKIYFENEVPYRVELLLASGKRVPLRAGVLDISSPVEYVDVGADRTELEFKEPLPTCLYDTVSRIPSDVSTLTCKRVIEFEHIKHEPEVRG
jgi:hypothetical protein